MVGEAVTVMAGLVLAYALVARWLTRANISAPMLSLLAGVVVFSGTALDVDTALVHFIAELTLVTILFHDASTVKFTRLRHDPGLSLRLLLIGFPLALGATFLVTDLLFPGFGVAGALLLAAAITPTDAGLGAPTVLNPVVPMRVRRGLNVESGLNDGLATPIVLLALAELAASEGIATPGVLQVGLIPVLLALAIALVVGLSAAWCMDQSRQRRLSAHRSREIAMFMIPLLLFGLADVIGANAFIAAFVGGIVFGAASKTLEAEHETSDLLEVSADLLSFVVWFLAGGVLLMVFESGFRWQWAALAILALTVLRMLPVALALIGTGLRPPTLLFIGWFGPRGLATIVFGLLAAEELGSANELLIDISGVIAITVVLSVVAHGISAGPLAQRYGEWAARTDPVAEGETSVEPRRARGTVHHLH